MPSTAAGSGGARLFARLLVRSALLKRRGRLGMVLLAIRAALVTVASAGACGPGAIPLSLCGDREEIFFLLLPSVAYAI